MEVIFGIIGAVGVCWGVYRDVSARKDRRRREEAETLLRVEREKREVRLTEPDIEVRLGGYGPEGGGVGAMLVSVIVANKGQHVARDVTFGLRYGDIELPAGPGGTTGGGMIAVLAAGERRNWSARVEPSLLGQLRAREKRLEAVMTPWVRYSDKLGNEYELGGQGRSR